MSVPAPGPGLWDWIFRPTDDGGWDWRQSDQRRAWADAPIPMPLMGDIPPSTSGGASRWDGRARPENPFGAHPGWGGVIDQRPAWGMPFDPGPPPVPPGLDNRGAVPQTPQAIQNYQGVTDQRTGGGGVNDPAFLQRLLANRLSHITAPGRANMDLSGAGVTYTAPADTYRWNWQQQARDPQGRAKGTSNYNKVLEWTQQYLDGNQARVSKWGAGLTAEQAFRRAVEQLLAEVRAKGGERAVARTGFQLR